ncbi:MAG: hypothetical protein Q7T93_13270 [Methylobacterium sp.]|uniref:hypothetical protein n=1 Tax=Methylobacterium sp. TaxID=409 RepID=UPI00271FA1BF|nr:hypothetical protein [Methylobacterium sp.]MDO9427787.1 hypothetical protein [Methylobacterium sp.]
MSGNPGLFDHVGGEARRFTVARVRATKAPIDPVEFDAFIRSTAEAYVAQGGTEVTEDMLRDVLPRVARFCAAMTVTPGTKTASNQLLFDALDLPIRQWTKAHRKATRAPVDVVALRAEVEAQVTTYRSIPGQAHDDDGHLALIERWVAFYGKMTAVSEVGTLKPGATWSARQEADFEVFTRLSWERYVAERDGVEPKRLGIDRLHNALRGLGMKRSAIRGAVERLRGRPERQATIDALAGTARDLVLVLESSGIPQSRITVVRTDALAEKLWPSTSVAATIRKRRQRLREAARDIEAAGIGVHVAVLGDHTIVGRGRLLPDGPDAVVVEAVRKGKVRTIPGGIIASRQGDWGSPEGQAAQALCRVVASHGGEEDMTRVLVEAGMTEAVDSFQAVFRSYRDMCVRDTLAWCTQVEERFSGPLRGIFSAPSSKDGEAVEAVRDLVATARKDGLGAAWTNFVTEGTTYAFRITRAEAAPARARITRIGKALSAATSPEAWEAAMLLNLASSRPGRRARVASLPPERRRPGQDDVAQTRTPPMLPTARTYVYSSRDEGVFVPAPVARDLLSPRLEMEIMKAWRINTLAPAVRDFHLTYLGMTREEAVDLHRLPNVPGDGSIPDIMEGLRRLLRTWGGPVGEADAHLDNALHEAIVWAGQSLKAHGGQAYVEAASVILTIVAGLGSVSKCQTLKGDLANTRAMLAFHLAKAAAKADQQGTAAA